jgi:hypothetical protein
MTTPTSENQWLSNIINSSQFPSLQAGTSSISYDDNGLIDSTSFELNWLRADDYGLAFLTNASAYNSFSDASDGFEGSTTIYLESYANEDADGYYYVYESLNTTDVSDPRYTLNGDNTYKVVYSNKEKTALQDRYTAGYDSFSDQLTAVFEGAVLTAVSSSYRSTNRYVFRKVKEPILNTKNVSALVTGSTAPETTTTATTTATTSY